MQELGKKAEVEGIKVSNLSKLSPIYGRPEQMPYVPEGEKIICGYDQGLGERLFVCETLDDMQELYDSYAEGWALNIHWYKGTLVEIYVVDIEPDLEIALSVVEKYAPKAPKLVKVTIARYSKGNPGAARVLAQVGKNFTSPEEVENLVGWPLSQNTDEKAGQIWERFHNQVDTPKDDQKTKSRHH